MLRTCLLSLCLLLSLHAQTSRRPLKLEDMHRIAAVGDPQCSPDGNWVAYTLGTVDTKEDKRDTDVWMIRFDGSQQIRVTSSPEGESAPRWSPDNRYLAFLSSRPGKEKGSQVWLLDRTGGEAQQLTNVKGRISEYEWSPDSKKLLLVMRELDEPEPEPNAKPKPPKPIVIDRYHFKQDVQGYLWGKHSHLYLFDIAEKKLEVLTSGDYDEREARISPDATRIAFVSNRDPEPDRTVNTDIYVMDAKPGAPARKLSTSPGPDSGPPSWSPDGKWIAWLQGSFPDVPEYNMSRVAVAPADGGTPKVVSESLDRGARAPKFTADGKRIQFLVTDDRSEYPASVSINGGPVERLLGGKRVSLQHSTAGQCSVLLSALDNAAPEIYAFSGGSLRTLTHHNDAVFSELQLGEVEEVSFPSKDGTDVHGLLTRPVGYDSSKKYPLLLRIHGGPNGQDQHAFSFENQFFAANGYAVLAVNYRGSAGRGQKYTASISGDWNNKEVQDLHAGIDYVIAKGIADPQRLGVGGWSYGGILTDALIASDTRFKAATSGAGVGFPLALYGVDQYIHQYDNELGPPWKSLDKYLKISYPLLKADRIKTPTLFLGGEKDFNVPLIGSEQMYQALRTLGIPTQLIIYPGEFHGIQRPSFQRDRMERYLAWYDKYLKPALSTSAGQ